MPRGTATSTLPWTVRNRRARAALKAGTAALALLVAAGAAAGAAEQGKLVRVSPGQSPFAGCTADKVSQQDGINYPNTEIEPFVDANLADRRNLIAVWQQDRWDNGGARGLVAGYSKDGGRTWTKSVPPGVSACTGGAYARASDPWVSISPYGVAYFMSLAFDPDLTGPAGEFLGFGDNAMLVSRSTDGGKTWGEPIVLIEDTDPQVLNDKNSLTADPTNPSLAYAVWDRLQDFMVPPPGDGGEASASAAAAVVAEGGWTGDGVALARERIRQLQAKAAAATADAGSEPTEVLFTGPTYFARTTDAGQTWEAAREIYDPGPNEQTLGNQIAVQPSGTLVNFFTHILPTGVTRLELIRSFDKGETWEKKPSVVTVEVTFQSITPDQQEPIRDAANLFDVAVDPRNGNLYAVLQEYRYRGVEEVSFLMSTDGGTTWSAPVRINKTPANRNPLRQQAIVPSIEVGPGGMLAVTYYDFRNDKNQGELTDYWAVTCSADCAQGASWGEELRLTNRSFDMLDAPIARGHFLGDYMGLVVAGDVAHPVFGIAERPDRTSVYTRRIKLGGAGEVAALP
jgi:hypothetical protein